jgi:hypothetical protein
MMFIDLVGIQPVEVLRSLEDPFTCFCMSFLDIVMSGIDLNES